MTGRGDQGRAWPASADIAAAVQRRWDNGSILQNLATGKPFEPITVPLPGPRASEIGDQLGAVRDWIAGLSHYDGARYQLVFSPIGGRVVGRNEIPTRAVITSIEQVSSLLGVGADVSRFREILGNVDAAPRVRAWVVAHPHRALALCDEIPQLIAAHRWLDGHRGSGRYLRQIDASGVDTKFVERHRTVLAAMLQVRGTAGGFTADLGLAAKPEMMRMRLDSALRLAPQVSEMTLRLDEAATLPLAPSIAMIVENEVTFLSVPVPPGGVVLWGRGFAVNLPGALPWLRDVPVVYWGDIDTHGFVILDRLRSHLPQAVSVLMDAETLLIHRDRWIAEDAPATRELANLTVAEGAVYAGLVTDEWGSKVRLEQERIDWAWVLARLC